MNILLLGASGFIGSKVLKHLRAVAELKIKCVTRKAPIDHALEENNVTYIEFDLLNKKADFESLLDNIDVIINCIGELDCHDDMRDVNLELVKRLVNSVKQSSTSQRLIQMSSVGCYGAVEKHRGAVALVSEGSEECPKGEYEITKTLADCYIREELNTPASLATYTILRPTNVIGETMKSSALKGLADAVRVKKFFYIGAKDNIFTFVDVEDVAAVVCKCVQQLEDTKNEVFIVSNDCAQYKIIDAIADFLIVPRPTIVIPATLVRLASAFIRLIYPSFPLSSSRIDSLASRVSFSNAKLNKLLGYEFEEISNDMIPFLLEKWGHKPTQRKQDI